MTRRELFQAGAASLAAAASGAAPVTSIRPRDNGETLVNPGMGWVLHHYDNSLEHYGSRLAPSDTVDDFPGVAVIYLRLAWSYLEPAEERFDWALVDTPAQRWIAKGKQVAFRFSCSESSNPPTGTPEWVRAAGARGYPFVPGKGVVEGSPRWEPDYDDPVFLAKLDRFLAAAAARYDGNPEVAFIDVGSFGVWGEGHTSWSSRVRYPAETVRRHIDLYLRHFRRTLLVANDDFASEGRGPEVIAYGRNRGLTLRDDSILVGGGAKAYYNAAMAQDFWHTVPVVLESEHFGPSRDRGYWQDGSRYLDAVEEYHASYASVHWWPREFLAANRALVERIGRRLGYRLQLVEAEWPPEVAARTAIRFRHLWRNAGVAPCLPGGHPAFTLKDAGGGIAAVFADAWFNARTLEPGPPDGGETRAVESTFRLPPILAPGAYELYVSMGTATGTPRIALPLADGDGQRRYRLGTLTVSAG